MTILHRISYEAEDRKTIGAAPNPELGYNQPIPLKTFADASAVLAVTGEKAVKEYATRRAGGAQPVDAFREAFLPYFIYQGDYSEMHAASDMYEAGIQVAKLKSDAALVKQYKAAKKDGQSSLSAFREVFASKYSGAHPNLDFVIAAALLDAAVGVTSPT